MCITTKFTVNKNIIALNSGRNCLKYIVRANNIKKIHCPYYTCDVVWTALKEENCKIEFYNINKMFMPEKEFNKNDFIIYTNYFGVCAKNVKILTKKYPYLIVDNSMAFYMPLYYGFASFNSARKFFNVTDGAFLKSPLFLNENFEIYKSYPNLSNFEIEEALDKNKKIMLISTFSVASLSNINYKKIKEIRLKNFETYHNKLSRLNQLELNLDENDVPFIYPYWTEDNTLRHKLAQNKINIARYWNNKFAKNIIPLPLNEKYNENDIKYISQLIRNCTINIC